MLEHPSHLNPEASRTRELRQQHFKAHLSLSVRLV
jgi:hypothetical protein